MTGRIRSARRAVLPVMLTALVLLLPATASAASDVGDYQLSLNDDPGIVMGDSSAILSLTLANTTAPGGDAIGWFRLYVDANSYYVSHSNTAPPGWTITEIKNAGVGQSYATYEATPGAELAQGDSVSIDLVVTGANDGPFPPDAEDATDSLESAAVQVNSSPNADFFTGVLPTWVRYGLKTILTAVPGSTGTGNPVTVSMAVTNRTTTSQAGITPGTLSVTSPDGGSVTLTGGPTPPSATILPGEQQPFLYSYTAATPGTVFFGGFAANTVLPAVSSPGVSSNSIVIGDFTASVTLDPVKATSGQQVTVTMTLTNNSASHITGISLGITPSGTATIVQASGPVPAGIANLPRGKSTSVSWVFTVTGNVRETYQFTVWGTDGVLTTNQAVTPTGSIFSYSAAVTPDNLTSGATGQTLTFGCSNAGGGSVRQVSISTPAGWIYLNATAPPGWTVSSNGNPVVVTFTTTTDHIPDGSSRDFSLTFTSVPVVTNPTSYNFLAGFWDLVTKLNDPPTGSVETDVTVLPYLVTLTASVPAGFPTPPVADGIQYYDLTATVTDGSGPVPGALVQFTTTTGSLGSASAVSDSNGQAVNTLAGPLSITPVIATVSADYLGATDTLLLNFDPYSGLALDYLPGSLSPVTVTKGDTVSFSLQVINADVAPVTLSNASTFAFSDTPAGGVSTYTANLAASAPTTIGTGQVATLTFTSTAVSAVFLQGSYFPDLVLTDGLRSGTKTLPDAVQVLGPATLLAVKAVTAVSDTINGTVDPKGIPGAVLEYTLSVSNVAYGSADTDSVYVTEPLPAGTELFVGDLGGGGSPVAFSDGSTASGLSYTFVGLGDTGDDIEFSSDAASPAFGYTPQDPDGDGFDPTVTFFRVNPKGTMAGASGPPYPSFSVIFRVRIK